MREDTKLKGNQPILITGATGTGKSVLAKRIHNSSEQSVGPFVHVNIAAISENL